MEIKLSFNASPRNVMRKSIIYKDSKDGTLTEGASITDPIFTIPLTEDDISLLQQVNYAFVPTFGRYYFIDDVQFKDQTTAILFLHVDVLMTYGLDILAGTAFVSTTEDYSGASMQNVGHNPDLEETFVTPGGLKAYCGAYTSFAYGLGSGSYVLITAG